MVNRYSIMYKYNSINHTNEKTEAFYCLKNNYDKEKTKYYTSSLSDNRNHIIVFSQYFRYRRQWKQVRAGRYKRLAADSRAMPGNGIHGRTDKTACLTLFDMLEIIFLTLDRHIGTLLDHGCYCINIFFKLTDNTDSRDILQFFFHMFHKNVFALHFFQDARHTLTRPLTCSIGE